MFFLNMESSHDFVCIVSFHQSLDKNPSKVSNFAGHPKRQIKFVSGRNHKISRSITLVHTCSLWVLSHGVRQGLAWPEGKLELQIACHNLKGSRPRWPHFKSWNPQDDTHKPMRSSSHSKRERATAGSVLPRLLSRSGIAATDALA